MWEYPLIIICYKTKIYFAQLGFYYDAYKYTCKHTPIKNA